VSWVGGLAIPRLNAISNANSKICNLFMSITCSVFKFLHSVVSGSVTTLTDLFYLTLNSAS